MNNAWNLNNIRKIAGLPLNESWDREDDDEDPDVKIASGDKRQAAFEKRNKKEIKAADAEASTLKKKPAAAAKPAEKKEEPAKAAPKAEEKKPEPKKEEPKAEEKKAEPAAEAKRRGAKPNESSKSGGMRGWMASNAGAGRGAFIAAAVERGMSKHHANSYYYQLKKKSAVKEGYILVHPASKSFVLAENYEMKRREWVDVNSDFEPFFFATEAAAQKEAKSFAEWNGQHSVVEKVVFPD